MAGVYCTSGSGLDLSFAHEISEICDVEIIINIDHELKIQAQCVFEGKTAEITLREPDQKALSHELIHVYQRVFMGLRHTAKRHYFNGFIYPNSVAYEDMPWERQAYAYESKIDDFKARWL